MELSRRDLLKVVAVAAGAGVGPRTLLGDGGAERLFEFPAMGNVTLLHITDPHATLQAVYYRE